MVKRADSAKEIGIDIKKGLDRYGIAAIGSISNDRVKTAAKQWGILPDGKHQLFEHTVVYSKTQYAIRTKLSRTN